MGLTLNHPAVWSMAIRSLSLAVLGCLGLLQAGIAGTDESQTVRLPLRLERNTHSTTSAD